MSISRYVVPDIYVTFFAILSLWLTRTSIIYRRPRWTTYAVYALMLAILFKYQAVFLAPVVLLAPLVQREAMRRVVAGNILRIALFLTWLLLFTPILVPPDPDGKPENWRQHTTSVGIPSPEILLYNLEQLLRLLDLRLLLPGWAGVALLALRRNREIRHALVLPAVAALAWMVGLSLFGTTDSRQMLAAATLLVLLAGAGQMLWLRALRDWSGRLALRGARLAPLALLLALLILALPSLRASLANAHEHTLPDTRNELANWADTTLASGKFFSSFENHKTFNRDWGGYAGSTVFEFVGEHPLDERPLEAWLAEGVRYAFPTWREYSRMLENDSEGFLSGTTLLKAWPPSKAHRGPSMAALALQSMKQPQPEATNQLGSIRLLGHDLEVSVAQAGAELPFQLYWQSDAPTDGAYIVFNHLLDAEGNLVAQADGPPLPGTRRTTADWDDPQETIISREFHLQLPDSLPAGEYRLINGWYRRDTGQRLLTPEGVDHIPLMTITLR